MGGWIDDWGHLFSLGSVAGDVPALLQRGMLHGQGNGFESSKQAPSADIT